MMIVFEPHLTALATGLHLIVIQLGLQFNPLPGGSVVAIAMHQGGLDPEFEPLNPREYEALDPEFEPL